MKQGLHSWWRFSLAAILITSTGIFLRSRGQAESLPRRQPLASFPINFGGWVGRTVVLSDEVVKILGDGEFLSRSYFRTTNDSFIDLFLAYFPTQRTSSTVHSPQNCLPGSGWTPVESTHLPLALSNGRTIIVNRYVVAKGADRMLVLYWYQSHGRFVASEYWAKVYLVADSIRMNRSDGALIRAATPVGRQEGAEQAEKRAVGFVRDLVPLLDSYIPN